MTGPVRFGRALAAPLFVGFLGASALHAQVANLLLKEGDPVPSVGPTEVIASFGNTEVNGIGGFTVGFNTSGGFSCFHGDPTGTGPGTLLRVESTIGNYLQTSFESFFGIDDAGSIAYSPNTNHLLTGVTGLDSVWLDNTPIAVEGDPIPTLPGTVWRFASRPKMLGNGIVYFIGGIDDAITGGDLGNGLFLGITPSPVLRSGDTIPGLPNPLLMGSAIDFDARFSRLGSHHLVPVALQTGSGVTTANDNYVLLDGLPISTGASVIGEDRPIPASHGGLPLEVWDNFDEVGVAESGEYMFYGDTDKAGTTTDEFIARNGIIVYRELDTFSGFQLVGSIESGYMNEAGDIVATWDVEGGTTDPEALLFNDKILARVGDAIDITGDGIPDAAFLRNFTGIANVGVGSHRPVWFTADWDTTNTTTTTDDLDGWFSIQDPCGSVRRYGVGCPGSGGFVPRVELSGCASPGGNVTLHVTNGLGGSTGFLFFGQSRAQAPLGGSCFLNVSPLFGVIVTLPLGGAGPGAGSISVPATIPPSTPAVTFTMQAFVADPASSIGGVGSAALEVAIQ
jgi:hypothetical protein